MVFERLDPRIQALLKDEGFDEPTPAQAAAFGPLLSGEHVLLLAPTGLGKTEAAMLPVLHQLLAAPSGPGVRAIYITPLRALNRDIHQRLVDWCGRLGFDIRVRHGDTPPHERQRQAANPPDVLITTPESLQGLFLGPRVRALLPNVRHVIVDEVHELVGEKRGAQLAVALERLARVATFQRIGLSATVGNPDAAAAWLGASRPVRTVDVSATKELDVRIERPTPQPGDAGLAEALLTGPEESALVRRLLEIVDQSAGTLAFTNTRRTAEVLAARLGLLERTDILVHHGSLSRESRIEAEERFRAREVKGLICTSSLELGIDVGHAEHVAQIGSPRQVARLIQRIGRAGHRWHLVSSGTILASEPDDIIEALALERLRCTGWVEPQEAPEAPLDVLANQLVAMALAGPLPAQDARKLLEPTPSFRHLDDATLRRVIGALEDTGLLRQRDGNLVPGPRARTHFPHNVGMIPDEAVFLVRDAVTRKPLGTLDESFVLQWCEPGQSIIFRGALWRVLEVHADDGELHVVPFRDPTSAVPSWVGEEIPVHPRVASEVGRIRHELVEDGPGAVPDEALDAAARDALLKLPNEQAPHRMPTHEVVTIEQGPQTIVVNACQGHARNEALSTVLAGLLSQRLGTSVRTHIDPYRVMLQVPRGVTAELVEKLLRSITPESVEPLVRALVRRSPLARFHLVHVARRMGYLERGSASRLRPSLVDRLLDTVAGEEAVNEILRTRVDAPGLAGFLEALHSGRLEVVRQPVSHVGALGLEARASLVRPDRATAALVRAVLQRLQTEPVVLACLHCRAWESETTVQRVRFPLRCGGCGAKMVALTRPWRTDERKAARQGPDAELWQRLHRSAMLLGSSGRRALLALVARGVGVDTASRLLRKHHGSEEALVRDLIEAEITYARTRGFWSN